MAKRRTDKIKREIADREAVRACAYRHGTIGDLSAMRICYLFRHHPELSVSQIARLVGLSVSATSRQLKKLKGAEILTATKQAQTVYYSLQENRFTSSLLEELAGEGKPRTGC